eukprot:gene9861-18448_t
MSLNICKKKPRVMIHIETVPRYFDAMYIKSGVIYNKSTGNYEGFADFGPDILAFDTDDVAKDALIFMLVDALEYIMFAGHSDFANADGTIYFIRTLDRLFDLLNARSLHDLMNATKDRFFSMA